jgi:KAP family P-loop domain
MCPTSGVSSRVVAACGRIILYIDDLDRCYPPSKVVKVLEAVHLLLFFPLFVIFVGVDSRWVSRALNRHYEAMLSDEALQGDEALHGLETAAAWSRAPADSQDLEKIFQVPFWLRRMDPPAVQRMIHHLIGSEEIEADDRQLEVDRLGEGGDLPDPGDDQAAPPATPTAVTSAASKDEARRAAPLRLTTEAEGYGDTIGEPAAVPAEALRIRQVELNFMNQVAPLMRRTPRAVKRFVNIYRLYKAALSTPGLDKFLGTPEHPGNFRAVQVFLALVIGSPDFAKRIVEILDGLAGTNTQRLSNLPELLAPSSNPTWQTTLAALAAFAEGDNDLELSSLREISPLVTRFSLHHMVSALPGESAALG